MGLLTGVGKDAGLSAAQEVNRTAQSAIDKIDHETIPAAEAAAKAIVSESLNTVYGIIVDALNRLHGAEMPIDITMTAHITGKIGPVKLSVPEQMDSQSVEVRG